MSTAPRPSDSLLTPLWRCRTKLRIAAKINAEYANAKVLPAALLAQQKGGAGPQRAAGPAAPQRMMIEGTF